MMERRQTQRRRREELSFLRTVRYAPERLVVNPRPGDNPTEGRIDIARRDPFDSRRHASATRLSVLLFAVLILTACGGTGVDYDRYVGMDGLIIRFAQNSPPEDVFENTPLPVKIYVQNKGATDVAYPDMVVTFSTDPLYLTGGINPYFPALQDPRHLVLLGRSQSYQDGEERLFDIPADASFVVKPIYGARETPETQITASVCYAYRTTASFDVCVDTNVYAQNEREQVCVEKDVTAAGGQGAPIAVTGVVIDSFPIVDRLGGTEVIKPHFTITVRDVGQGRLIGPDSLPMETACLLKAIPDEELATVRIDAFLLKTRLECKPSELVKLYEGEGQVRCTVPDNDLTDPIYQSTQNFQTTLTINLTYLYKNSVTTDLKITRVPGTERPDVANYGLETGYMYSPDGTLLIDENEQPVTKCAYYAAVPEEKPTGIVTEITPGFQCGCNYERCVRLGITRCAGWGLCPAGQFCCDDTIGITATFPVTVDGHVSSIGSDPDRAAICKALEGAADLYNIPADILKAVAYQESTWDNTPAGSSDGGQAHGVMQIHQKYHPDYDIARGDDDAAYNIEYGASFLASLYQMEKDWRTAVRRYNGAGSAAESYATRVMDISRQKPWESRDWCGTAAIP